MSDSPFPLNADYVPSSPMLDDARGLGVWVRGASILTITAAVAAGLALLAVFDASFMGVLAFTVAVVILGCLTLRLREVAAAMNAIERQPNAISTAFGLEAIARLFTLLGILAGLGVVARLLSLFELLA